MHSRLVPLALLAWVALACGAEDPRSLPVTTLEGEGRWAVAPSGPDLLDASQREMIARLESIGYAQGVALAQEDTGVRVLDPERAWPGFALYVSGHAPEALLVDLTGRVLHRWHVTFDERSASESLVLSNHAAAGAISS